MLLHSYTYSDFVILCKMKKTKINVVIFTEDCHCSGNLFRNEESKTNKNVKNEAKKK